MAAHHPYTSHLYCHPATTATSTVCCCTSCTPSHHHPPIPDPHPLHHYRPTQTNFYSPYSNGPNPNPPCTTQTHHHHQQPQYHPPPSDIEKELYFHQLHHDQQRELTHTHPIVSSLLRRITALESSLRHRSSSHSNSLRDTAARTIQTHFRAFLVRRSRTFRQLKDLASIKSTLNMLKSSVSENPHFDPQSLSLKALKLLFKLDSIQGGDPMIRDGKKSIRRELTRFMDLIDGVTSEISARLVKKNVTRKCGGLYNDQKRGNVGCPNLAKNKRLEDLVDRIDALYTKVTEDDDVGDEEDLEIPSISQNKSGHFGKRDDGVGAKVKKSVSFVENGKEYKVHRPVSAGDCDSGDDSDSVGAKGEFEEDVLRKAEEFGGILFKETEEDEDDHSQDGESTQIRNVVGGPMYELRDEDGGLTFSAPLPVKMETRTDMMDNRETVKRVGKLIV